MTFREAATNGVERIRKPYWNKYAYLELPRKVEGDMRGPWCTLVDPCSGAADPTLLKTPILWTEVDNEESDWEPFAGEAVNVKAAP